MMLLGSLMMIVNLDDNADRDRDSANATIWIRWWTVNRMSRLKFNLLVVEHGDKSCS